MRLKVMTSEALVLDEEVLSVTLPGTEGQMTLLPGHAALLATLKRGKIFYKVGERNMDGGMIEGGVVEVLKNEILILAKGFSELRQ